ncbi:MAG: 3' terminal RNA ribose 2'-O-methyltransferase Hen1 [Salinarimonas sp.]|nr:3' terminal RNA ribose 2'-O-methyltransferase Hen1 [Salinarimonas sp.]
MQVELTLQAPPGSDYSARDLGHLLHKHPDRVHVRDAGTGCLTVFFAQKSDAETRAILHLDVDPVALVRGREGRRGGPGEGLFGQYVNDRPYAANSLLSVALGRGIGQALAGRSKERQALAERALPFELRVTPLAVHGDAALITRLFAPLGYGVEAIPLGETGLRAVFDLKLTITARLCDILGHLSVLIPVLDDAKHYWVDDTEIDKLVARAGDWLERHPARELITRRALKHRRDLVADALARLDLSALDEDAVAPPAEEGAMEGAREAGAAGRGASIRLHDQRLDAVAAIIAESGARSVLDLGCGEGRLIRRLAAQAGISRILGIDPSRRALEAAAARLRLDEADERMRERVRLQAGSLTYGDRRWRGFDAATLVEVIEHIDPARLPALEAGLFGDARPGIVVVTTPDRAYNAAFAGMDPGALRHDDHRFEWDRAEFAAWAGRVADRFGYGFEIRPLGPVDPVHGAPSQLALFTREVGA